MLLHTTMKTGGMSIGLTPTIDAVEVARRLLSVERQLAQILAQGR